MPTKSRNRRSPKKLARRMKPTRRLSRRKGSGKKGSARARIPKKLRGGVTRRRLSQLTQQELSTALRLLPADVVKQIGKRHPLLIPPLCPLRNLRPRHHAGRRSDGRSADRQGIVGKTQPRDQAALGSLRELSRPYGRGTHRRVGPRRGCATATATAAASPAAAPAAAAAALRPARRADQDRAGGGGDAPRQEDGGPGHPRPVEGPVAVATEAAAGSADSLGRPQRGGAMAPRGRGRGRRPNGAVPPVNWLACLRGRVNSLLVSTRWGGDGGERGANLRAALRPSSSACGSPPRRTPD